MNRPKPCTKEHKEWMQASAKERGKKLFSGGSTKFYEHGIISGKMNNKSVWIIKSEHIEPNDFYVKVDGSCFYTAYWIANALSDKQATSLILEFACVK